MDLARHRLILYTLADNWTELRFRKGTETITVPVNGALNANDGQLIRHAGKPPTIIIQSTGLPMDDDLLTHE